MAQRQRLAVMGSTGSIGVQTLDIVRARPELFEITTLTAQNRWQKLAAQAIEFNPDHVVIANEQHYNLLKEALAPYPIKVYAGESALEQVVCSDEVDAVVMALVGYSGLFPSVAALKSGKKLALANKECLVVGGEILMALSARHQAPILPIDSEHSAIFQCLVGEQSEIEKVILTASGGPFLDHSIEELRNVTPQDALKHPYWEMGQKVTIDSASLMNKGFEVIEAHWLFGLQSRQIEVLIHPGSIVHSMVQFSDGAIKAQLGTPDMHLPIQYALTFPQRLALGGERIEFSKWGQLSFLSPDLERFPNLQLAYEVLELGGNAGAILNAANEVAVTAFLNHKIRFTDIPKVNRKVLERISKIQSPSLEACRESDREARELAQTMISQ